MKLILSMTFSCLQFIVCQVLAAPPGIHSHKVIELKLPEKLEVHDNIYPLIDSRCRQALQIIPLKMIIPHTGHTGYLNAYDPESQRLLPMYYWFDDSGKPHFVPIQPPGEASYEQQMLIERQGGGSYPQPFVLTSPADDCSMKAGVVEIENNLSYPHLIEGCMYFYCHCLPKVHRRRVIGQAVNYKTTFILDQTNGPDTESLILSIWNNVKNMTPETTVFEQGLKFDPWAPVFSASVMSVKGGFKNLLVLNSNSQDFSEVDPSRTYNFLYDEFNAFDMFVSRESFAVTFPDQQNQFYSMTSNGGMMTYSIDNQLCIGWIEIEKGGHSYQPEFKDCHYKIIDNPDDHYRVVDYFYQELLFHSYGFVTLVDQDNIHQVRVINFFTGSISSPVQDFFPEMAEYIEPGESLFLHDHSTDLAGNLILTFSRRDVRGDPKSPLILSIKHDDIGEVVLYVASSLMAVVVLFTAIAGLHAYKKRRNGY